MRSCRETAAEEAQLWGTRPRPAVVPIGPSFTRDASSYIGPLAREVPGHHTQGHPAAQCSLYAATQHLQKQPVLIQTSLLFQ